MLGHDQPTTTVSHLATAHADPKVAGLAASGRAVQRLAMDKVLPASCATDDRAGLNRYDASPPAARRPRILTLARIGADATIHEADIRSLPGRSVSINGLSNSASRRSPRRSRTNSAAGSCPGPAQRRPVETPGDAVRARTVRPGPPRRVLPRWAGRFSAPRARRAGCVRCRCPARVRRRRRRARRSGSPRRRGRYAGPGCAPRRRRPVRS